MYAAMINRPATAAPKHARRVRIVHHHDAVESLGQIAQRRQIGDIAFHRKHTVGDQQLFPRPILGFFQHALAIGDVLVFENLNRRAGQPASIDNRRVIQLIRDDQIFFAQNGRDRSRIRRESRLETRRTPPPS